MTKAAKKSIDSHDIDVVQGKPRDLPTTGDARLDASIIETADGPLNRAWAEEMQFMNEEIEVMVHESSDKNAEFIVEVWNDGRAQRFLRGQPVVVKRKYVEVLGGSKITTYRQEHYKDANGNDAIRNVPTTSARYPFQVLRDANPRGADWLRKLMARG